MTELCWSVQGWVSRINCEWSCTRLFWFNILVLADAEATFTFDMKLQCGKEDFRCMHSSHYLQSPLSHSPFSSNHNLTYHHHHQWLRRERLLHIQSTQSIQLLPCCSVLFHYNLLIIISWTVLRQTQCTAQCQAPQLNFAWPSLSAVWKKLNCKLVRAAYVWVNGVVSSPWLSYHESTNCLPVANRKLSPWNIHKNTKRLIMALPSGDGRNSISMWGRWRDSHTIQVIVLGLKNSCFQSHSAGTEWKCAKRINRNVEWGWNSPRYVTEEEIQGGNKMHGFV